MGFFFFFPFLRVELGFFEWIWGFFEWIWGIFGGFGKGSILGSWNFGSTRGGSENADWMQNPPKNLEKTDKTTENQKNQGKPGKTHGKSGKNAAKSGKT